MISIKSLVLGNLECGKTSIIKQYTLGIFDDFYSKTTGMSFSAKDISESAEFRDGARHEIWDSPGESSLHSMIVPNFQTSAAFIFVFSVVDLDSFRSLKPLIEEVDRYRPTTSIKLLIGNKSDLKKIVVPIDEINILCASYGMEYIETSARQNFRIKEIFTNIEHHVSKSIQQMQIIPTSDGQGGIRSIPKFTFKSFGPGTKGGAAEANTAENINQSVREIGCIENACSLI